MSRIITGTSSDDLIQLFPPQGPSGNLLGQITNGITEAVHTSFAEGNMRNPTRDEIRRRFNICVKWAKVFRGDLKFGIQRIVGELPNALRAELLGVPYEPPTRTSWIAGDGA